MLNQTPLSCIVLCLCQDNNMLYLIFCLHMCIARVADTNRLAYNDQTNSRPEASVFIYLWNLWRLLYGLLAACIRHKERRMCYCVCMTVLVHTCERSKHWFRVAGLLKWPISCTLGLYSIMFCLCFWIMSWWILHEYCWNDRTKVVNKNCHMKINIRSSGAAFI